MLIFLRKLAALSQTKSSECRRNYVAEYLGFDKRQNETISESLVRETLSYEGFQEALIRLREERSGTDPSLQDFGLEEIFRDRRMLSGIAGEIGVVPMVLMMDPQLKPQLMLMRQRLRCDLMQQQMAMSACLKFLNRISVLSGT